MRLSTLLALILVSCGGNKGDMSAIKRQYALNADPYNQTFPGMAASTPVNVPWDDAEKLFLVSGANSGTEIAVSGGSVSALVDVSANTVTIVRGGKATLSNGTVQIVPGFNGLASDAALSVGQGKAEASSVQVNPIAALVRFSVTHPSVRKVSFSSGEGIFPGKVTFSTAGRTAGFSVKKQSVSVSVNGVGEYYIPVIPGFSAVNLSLEWEDASGFVLGGKQGILEWESTVGGMLDLGTIENLVLGDSDIPLPDPSIPQAEPASLAVQGMGVGLNITGLEHCWGSLITQPHRQDPTYYETAGGYGLITERTMKAVADAGFKCVRIPVTWHLHMDNIRAQVDKIWLDRVEQVVDYALDAGLYVIINMHHDAGTRVGRWCISDVEHYEQASEGINNIWTQVATRFRDKDYRLLFEGYNEILDGADTWTYPRQAASMEVANRLLQDFVYAVRRTGGKNGTRILILNTYAASASERAVAAFRMPKDITAGHLMVEFHSYVPSDFCTQQTAGRDHLIEDDFKVMEAAYEPIEKYFLAKKYPCVLGEFGAFPREGRSEEDRAEHAGYMTRLALNRGIVPIIWYSPMSGSRRSDVVEWEYPGVKDAMIQAYNDYISGK